MLRVFFAAALMWTIGAAAQTSVRTADQVYKEYLSANSMVSMELASKSLNGQFAWPSGPSFEKSMELHKELDALADSGDAMALFYDGVLKHEFATKIARNMPPSDQTRRMASDEFS